MAIFGIGSTVAVAAQNTRQPERRTGVKAASVAPYAQDKAILSSAPVTFYRGISAGSSVQWTSENIEVWPAHDMAATRPNFSLKGSLGLPASSATTRNIEAALTSQVDRYLSFSSSVWDFKLGQRGSRKTTLSTIDMTTGKPAKLTDIFPKDVIYKALMQDTVVQKQLNGDQPGDLDELVKRLRVGPHPIPGFTFSDNILTNFAFDHVKGNQVAVRLAMSGAIPATDGFLTQVGIYLPVPAKLAKALADKNRIVTVLGSEMGYPFDVSQVNNNRSKLTFITNHPNQR